jgi:hypothetical protein
MHITPHYVPNAQKNYDTFFVITFDVHSPS